MNTFPLAFRRLLLPALVLAASAASAPAQTIITTAPYTITQAGSYRLGANLSVSAAQSVITVSAPNVEVDLGGYTVTAPVTSDGTTVIIIKPVSNVTIRNGTVAGGGFGIGFLSGAASSNHLVENVRVVGSGSGGIAFVGASPGSVIRNNLIVNVGNNLGNAIGIETGGGVLIMDNAIGKVTARSTSSAYGISSATSDFIIGNTINECTVGISGGKYLNNLTYGCATPFANGVNAAGNN